MIPQKIQAIFDFIDYLDSKKEEYLEKYIPLCTELSELDDKRGHLQPRKNYKDKLQHRTVQAEISEKFNPITEEIYKPVVNKMLELEILSGDGAMASIWNNNLPAISDFIENFVSEDVPMVINYKKKYLDFRNETNSNFLSLQMVFSSLDEVLKELFDFFKDTNENEFALFETKTVEVSSIEEAVRGFAENIGGNVRFSIQQESLFDYQNVRQYYPQLYPQSNNIKNEIIMGHKIQVGDISNNSGQIVIGKDIKVSDSLNGKNETADKIVELISLIRKEQNIADDQKQTLITNFDKVKEELFEDQPSKSKIFKWLSNTKSIFEKLVFSHEVTQAFNWVYSNLWFIFI